MKRKYVKPEIEIIDAGIQSQLLSGSTGEENPWWKEPEVEEGCQSAWWCGK